MGTVIAEAAGIGSGGKSAMASIGKGGSAEGKVGRGGPLATHGESITKVNGIDK